MDDHKLEWLAEHLRCPGCGGRPLGLAETEASCPSCGRRYRRADGVIDFLDEQSIDEFNIVSTDNVSDHPFDGNARTIIDRCADADGWVLDCGSGYKTDTFPNLIQMEIVRYPNVDLLAVNQRLPFVDDSFDAVFSLDVLEHVNDPFTSAAEIVRVLKPGGILYLDLPFLQAEHGYPHHYFNATRMGARQLFNDLDVLSHHVPLSGHPIFTLHQLLAVYLDGLSGEQRERFAQMPVSELLAKGPIEWLSDPLVAELRVESRWAIASTTQALLRKPERAGVASSGVTIAATDMPEFPRLPLPPPPVAEGPAKAQTIRQRLRRLVRPGV